MSTRSHCANPRGPTATQMEGTLAGVFIGERVKYREAGRPRWRCWMLRELLYRLYQSRLEAALRRTKMPNHVGVILDGNRRYARKNGFMHVGLGHKAGADKAEELIEWCDDLGIPVVTVWVLST